MGRKFIEKMCVAVPYYEAPSLLDRNSRVAVVTNSKGWAYDVWDLPTFWITSGYSPKGPIVPPSCTKDLDEAAKGKDVWDRLQLRIEFGRRILRWYEENNIEWK